MCALCLPAGQLVRAMPPFILMFRDSRLEEREKPNINYKYQ